MRFRIDFKRLFGRATDTFFAMGLTGTTTFHEAIRPVLNGHSGNDVHKAQALAIEGLHAHLHVVRRHSDRFLEAFSEKLSYEGVKVRMAGRDVVPVGAASGLDPGAEALVPFSYLFGFQMPGPVMARPRLLERVPFVDDGREDNLYVPPVFSSEGLDPFRERLRRYREEGGNAVILPSVVGLVPASGDIEAAFGELEIAARSLAPYSDGFVWCPFWSGSRGLIAEEPFARAAEILSQVAGRKLRLVEMFACEEDQQEAWLRLVGSFLSGGGDGIVAVTGLVVPAERMPRGKAWELDTAVMCGRGLAAYRARAIEAARRSFPGAFIAACGGFHGREDAFDAVEHANVIAENEAFTRYGPGMARVLLQKLVLRLNLLQRRGELERASLREFQEERWRALGTGDGPPEVKPDAELPDVEPGDGPPKAS